MPANAPGENTLENRFSIQRIFNTLAADNSQRQRTFGEQFTVTRLPWFDAAFLKTVYIVWSPIPCSALKESPCLFGKQRKKVVGLPANILA